MNNSSKDNTIKFWDIVSGLCIRTISSHLGEVTSVEMNSSGTLLLSSSKDNSNRLWDVRMVRPIRKLKGHQNTSKNFIRANFADNNLIVGGSEDGIVYIWDQETGEVLQKLRGHQGVVYDSAWNAKQGMLASCSDDQTCKVWWYDDAVSIFYNWLVGIFSLNSFLCPTVIIGSIRNLNKIDLVHSLQRYF